MSIDVGQTQTDVRMATDFSGVVPRVHLKEGLNYHRVITGPIKIRPAFWRTYVTDEKTGEMKVQIKTALCSDNSIFDKIASKEIALRQKMGQSKPNSVFRPRAKWAYKIFDLSEPIREVKVAEYPKTVFDIVVDTQKKQTKDGLKLKYGFVHLYPWVIERIVESGMSSLTGTSYKAYPDVESDLTKFWAGKLPVSVLSFSKEQIQKFTVNNIKKIFTDEEVIAQEECEFTLPEIYKVMSDEEVMEKLAKFPIALNATDQNDRPWLPYPEEFVKMFKEFEIGVIEEAITKKLSPPQQQPSKEHVSKPVQTLPSKPVDDLVFGDDTPAEGADDATWVDINTDVETTTQSQSGKAMDINFLGLKNNSEIII